MSKNRQRIGCVIMPFRRDFEDVMDLAIRPVGKDLGLRMGRVDDKLFQSRQIYEEIISSIEEADIVIADMSGSNPNVFYEMGQAHARKKLVIPISSDPPESVPFDIAGFRIVFLVESRGGAVV